MTKDLERLEDLTPDPENANDGTLRGSQLLDRSLDAHGLARGITSDRNGVVMAGNKTFDQTVERQVPIRVVRSNGKKLVVVQRMDLDITDPKTRELAYLDNRSADVGLKWNPQQVSADVARGVVSETMFTPKEYKRLVRAVEAAAPEEPSPFVTVSLAFVEDQDRAAFQTFLSHVQAHFPGETPGVKMSAWVRQQLIRLDHFS